MDVAMYLRKSRAEEHEDTEQTLRRHRSELTAHIASSGLTLSDTYEEVVSGESLYARPQMLRLLARVEEGGYDAVVCMDIDRLGRGGMRDQGIILDAFKYSGTKIITPEKTYDLTDELDEELTEFKTFLSRREYKIITKRLQRGLKHVIGEGGYVANAPYGYRKAYVDKRPTLAIEEEEAKFVRMIFDMYCGGAGCTAIANTLNALGARPRRSDRFGRNSIMHILRNPTFTGKVVWNRKRRVRKGGKEGLRHVTIYQPEEAWTVVEGIHPPIISRKQFETAQNIARSRYIPPANDGTVKNPLAGLLKCKRCGKSMQRMCMGGGTYLMCCTAGCCAGAKLEYVEAAILDSLRDTLARIPAVPPEIGKEEAAEHTRILQSARGAIRKAERQRDGLHDLLEQGIYDPETYRARMEALSKKLSRLREQEAEKTTALNRCGDSVPPARTTVFDVYCRADAKGRNRVLKSIIDYIVYEKPKKTKPQAFFLSVALKIRPSEQAGMEVTV